MRHRMQEPDGDDSDGVNDDDVEEGERKGTNRTSVQSNNFLIDRRESGTANAFL